MDGNTICRVGDFVQQAAIKEKNDAEKTDPMWNPREKLCYMHGPLFSFLRKKPYTFQKFSNTIHPTSWDNMKNTIISFHNKNLLHFLIWSERYWLMLNTDVNKYPNIFHILINMYFMNEKYYLYLYFFCEHLSDIHIVAFFNHCEFLYGHHKSVFTRIKVFFEKKRLQYHLNYMWSWIWSLK